MLSQKYGYLIWKRIDHREEVWKTRVGDEQEENALKKESVLMISLYI